MKFLPVLYVVFSFPCPSVVVEEEVVVVVGLWMMVVLVVKMAVLVEREESSILSSNRQNKFSSHTLGSPLWPPLCRFIDPLLTRLEGLGESERERERR